MTTTPSTTKDHDNSNTYGGLLYSGSSLVISDASSSYQSPYAISNVAQYESEIPASPMTLQLVVTSSFTNSGLSSLNFGLAQDHDSHLLSCGLSLTSAHVTSPLVVTSSQPATISYATSFPISTSTYSTTSVGINLSSFNGNFLQTNFPGLGTNFTSGTAESFPQSVTHSSTVSSITQSLSYLGSNPNSAFPTFSNNFPASSVFNEGHVTQCVACGSIKLS